MVCQFVVLLFPEQIGVWKWVLLWCHLPVVLIRWKYEVVSAAEANLAPFDLAQNWHTKTALVTFFGLVMYNFVELVANTETYAILPHLRWFVGAGVMTWIGGMLWLRRVDIPAPESMVVSLLLGVALGFSLYSGILRLNQLTDRHGLQV